MSWHSRWLLLFLNVCGVVSSLPLRFGVINRCVMRWCFAITVIKCVEITRRCDRLVCLTAFVQIRHRTVVRGPSTLDTGALLDMVVIPATTDVVLARWTQLEILS